MRVNGLTKGFFILIVFIVTLAFFDVLSPYYSAILWAAILAVIFNPVKNKIRTRLGERSSLAALLTIVIICLIVFTPLAIILSSLAYELNVVYSKLQHNDTQFPTVVASLFAHLPGWARSFLAEHNLDSAQQIQQQLSDVALKSGQYLAGSAFLIGKRHLWLYRQLRHYAVPAVLPAEGWALPGAVDSRISAVIELCEAAPVR